MSLCHPVLHIYARVPWHMYLSYTHSHVWRSNVTHMNGRLRTHVKETCHTCEWCSAHTCERVTSHIWMVRCPHMWKSHVTHLKGTVPTHIPNSRIHTRQVGTSYMNRDSFTRVSTEAVYVRHDSFTCVGTVLFIYVTFLIHMCAYCTIRGWLMD